MKKTLALVMVVKNEEMGLEKAILSCKDFVDEIVIAVDYSSTDKTAEIARKYATKLKMFTWKDNFAEARNFAHSGVKSDYILFLDGHEYVSECSELETALNLGVDGLLCTITMENGMSFRNPRIYKNGLQFSGAVHENIPHQKTAVYSKFVIQHDRIKGQAKQASEAREEQRKDQLPRIMGNLLKKNKKDLRASFHLALYYQSVGNYKLALRYQRIYLKHSVLSGERWFVLFNRALIYLTLKKYFRAFLVANLAQIEEPNRWENEKLKGLIFFNKGKIEKALECFVDSFNENKKDFAYKPWKRDDAGTWNLIGECFYRLGVYDKASTAFQQASEQAQEKIEKSFFKQRADLVAQLVRGRKD